MSKYKSPQEERAEELRALVKQAYVKPQDIEKRDQKRAKEGYLTIDYYHDFKNGDKYRIGHYDSRTEKWTSPIGTLLEKPSWDG